MVTFMVDSLECIHKNYHKLSKEQYIHILHTLQLHIHTNTQHTQTPLGTERLLSVAHFKASNIKPD